MMNQKITLAIIVVLAIIMIIPTTAFAQQRDVSKEAFVNRCETNVLVDEKKQFNEFQCVYFPEIWNQIIELFDVTSELQTSMNNTTTQVSDLEYRLQVLEGKIHAPYVDLSVHVHPEKISKGEKFVISGSADRMEQYWIDFNFYNPDGESIQNEWVNVQPDNIYFSDVLEPNSQWDITGNYTVVVTHGPHTVNATIQYITESP